MPPFSFIHPRTFLCPNSQFNDSTQIIVRGSFTADSVLKHTRPVQGIWYYLSYIRSGFFPRVHNDHVFFLILHLNYSKAASWALQVRIIPKELKKYIKISKNEQ